MSKIDKSFKEKSKTNTKLKSKSKSKCKSRTRKNLNKNRKNGLMGGGWKIRNLFKSSKAPKIKSEIQTLVTKNPISFSQETALKHFGNESKQNLYASEYPVKQRPGENPYQYLSKPGNTYMDVSLPKSNQPNLYKKVGLQEGAIKRVNSPQNQYSILNRDRSEGPRKLNTPSNTKESIEFAKYAAKFNKNNSINQAQKLNRFNTSKGNSVYEAQQKQRKLELENRKLLQSLGQPITSKYVKSANNVAKQIAQAKLNAAKFEESEKGRKQAESIITAKSGNYNVASPGTKLTSSSQITKEISSLYNTY